MHAPGQYLDWLKRVHDTRDSYMNRWTHDQTNQVTAWKTELQNEVLAKQGVLKQITFHVTPGLSRAFHSRSRVNNLVFYFWHVWQQAERLTLYAQGQTVCYLISYACESLVMYPSQGSPSVQGLNVRVRLCASVWCSSKQYHTVQFVSSFSSTQNIL